MRDAKWLFLTGLLAAIACGGSGGSDGGADSGSNGAQDAGVDAGPPVGPSPGVCAPSTGQTGNSLNVGAYCTHGGGQCAQYSNGALACAIDLSTSGGDFCILIGCMQNSDCGNAACCTGNGGPINACVPSGCLVADGGACPPVTPADGGADAGPDAG